MYDSVIGQIRNGTSATAPEIAKLCGANIPDPLSILCMILWLCGQIRNGTNSTAPVIAKLCGANIPDPLSILCMILRLTVSILNMIMWLCGQIRNGTNSTAPEVAKLCGADIPDPVFISSNTAFLTFVTDSSVQHPGYDITYVASTNGKQEEEWIYQQLHTKISPKQHGTLLHLKYINEKLFF